PTTMWAAVSIVTSNRTRRGSDFFITGSCVWAPAPSAPPANLTTSFLVTAVMSTPPWLSGLSPLPCPSPTPLHHRSIGFVNDFLSTNAVFLRLQRRRH